MRVLPLIRKHLFLLVNIQYVNTGSSPTSIDSVLLNGVPYSSYMPHATLDKDFGTLPSICETGASKSGAIIISPGAADPSGNRLTDGITLVVTLHTTGGKDYSASVALLGGGSVSSTVKESSNSSLNDPPNDPPNGETGVSNTNNSSDVIRFYWDQDCTRNVYNIDWGVFEPGMEKGVTIYIINKGDVPVNTSLLTGDWNPEIASQYISLSWNYNGQSIKPNETVPINLNLKVSPAVSNVGNFTFIISISTGSNNLHAIASSGLIVYSGIFLTVNSSKVITLNQLSLGFQLDFEWKDWLSSSARRELSGSINPKLIRIFDWRDQSSKPCIYWDESTRTGTFNWEDVDALVSRIYAIGAEPMFCLGAYASGKSWIPSGMSINQNTNLPYPESFAAYATEWVKHFKSVGLLVKYYEIWNEPWTYFGWEPVDTTKLSNYMQLFNAAARSMRTENPDLSISFDFIMRKDVMDYWLANGGADVDSLDFHKYDDWVTGHKTDEKMFQVAENDYFNTDPLGYSITEARQVWFNARGKLLPIINSESNFNAAWETGTDPRIQQMAGAVWTALVLRMDILNGVSYNVYYCFSSSASSGSSTPTGGAGFGMVNTDNNRPWYPYYVHYMIGNNLAVGDSIVYSEPSSDDIRSLAWIHNGLLNILLICKVDQPRTIYLQGIQGQVSYSKIDNAISWKTPSIQSGTLDSTQSFVINGYTVALFQIRSSP